MPIPYQCNVCQRLTGYWKCEAFPKGIPTELLRGVRSHRFPYSGDKGLLFLEAKAVSPIGILSGRLTDKTIAKKRPKSILDDE